jgi:chromosome segregation protein
MLRLDKLEIFGFKSFYEPAELFFPAPLTAVVGPNGCGKSNICDAIIWVLGENRASHIRGDTMDDVIFKGSAKRRALGMGEVTLTLTTDNGHEFAQDDGRVVINRRVFRTGESEFRLNGKRVRLRDISDALMDTGLGIRNYSVMEQGKIDLIISNKPQDRRKLIEEAAGITKYKAKRRAAEMKLEETQANLVRIDDTLLEITRNLNSLKRQASKARKHKEVVELLSTAKRSLYAGRAQAARTEQESAEQSHGAAQGADAGAATALAALESELSDSRTLLAQRATDASDLRELVTRLESEASRLRSLIEQSEAGLADLATRSELTRTQLTELEAEGLEQQTALDARSSSLEGVLADRNRLREVAEELELARQQRADEVRVLEKRLADARELLMRTIARISEARNQVHQIEIAAEKCEFYLGKLGETARRATESRDGALDRSERAEAAVHEARLQSEQAEDRLREAQLRRDELTAQRDSMRQSLSASRDLISQTTYKIDSLRGLLATLEAQDEDVRRAILDIVPNAISAAESVRAAKGFEAALDALLREISKAIAVDDSRTAIDAIARLRERGAGRGAFLVTGFASFEEGGRRGNLSDAIIGEGPVADAVRDAVPEAYVAENLDEALREATRRPRAVFVTREGDIVRGPLVIGGRHESAQPGVFSLKRELSDLEQVLGVEEVRASGIALDLERVEIELRAADDDRIVAEERRRQSEQALRDREVNRDRIAEELQRFEMDLFATSEEREVYEEERSQLTTRHAEAVEALHALETAEEATHQTIRGTEEALSTARVEFESATDSASKARFDLETSAGVVTSMEREHENLSRVVASILTRLTQFQSEISGLETKRDEIAGALDGARGQLETTLRSLDEGSTRRTEVEQEVASLDERVRALEADAVTGREGWNALREELFEAQRRVDRSRGAFDLLREQVLLDLHAGLEALDDAVPPPDEESRATLESEVARLSDQLDRIGPVNVLAIDEHRELEERETFLRTQRDDLVQSIESLRGTIRKINMTSRELFRDAFNKVNESFGELFRLLFGGGKANMRLLDEEDVLESGIELVAQPPGKATESISALSGGERALTALALLFAIFRYKPSPFCILDEVDAPLDEVNNNRFIRLVREMSAETQFIMITHSRRTMEAADVLYGVTMEEAGCSKLVSVSFAELEAS